MSLFGEALGRLGDVARAHATSAQFAEEIEETRRSGPDVEGVNAAYLSLGRAQIAAALGEREQAVRLLEEGFRLTRHKGDSLPDVRHELFELLHDYLPFQEFVRPRG